MMWKTIIILAVTSAVLAGKLHKRDSEYKFHIKHDYDYHKHHEKLEHHKDETEEKPQEEKQAEEVKEEENNEETESESEGANESNGSNAESEDSEKEEGNNMGYEFLYKVIDPHTHDKKGQHEKKDGGEIQGVYWLLQPDGYKRTVDYHTDKHNGFHAKVDYSKAEEPTEEEKHSKAKSEYYVKTYHGKHIPVKEEQEEEEQNEQQESARNIPIYVI